jgi:hypothetical protein
MREVTRPKYQYWLGNAALTNALLDRTYFLLKVTRSLYKENSPLAVIIDASMPLISHLGNNMSLGQLRS